MQGRGHVVQQQSPLAQISSDGKNITVSLVLELLKAQLVKLFLICSHMGLKEMEYKTGRDNLKHCCMESQRKDGREIIKSGKLNWIILELKLFLI